MSQLTQRLASPIQPAHAPPRRGGLIWVLLIGVIVGAFWLGLTARRFTWDATQSVRRSEDLCNGWGWGERALRYGFFRLYDHVIADRPDGDYTLDYTPLRLAVMTVWARWTNHFANGAAGWRDDYNFTAPLLHLNTAMALLSAIGVYLLVGRWSPSHPKLRGLIAALFFWFNPALLLDAHGWPQWDVWPLPFFIFALLACSTERWLLTGALLAVGTMLKGQVMLVAPLFVLWPLFGRRWRVAGDVVVAFVATVALIASPWLIGRGGIWVVTAVALGVFFTRSAALRAWRWRIVLATAAAALFVCPILFGGSMSWFRIGFTYGVAKFPDMAVGAENLAALLQRCFAMRCQDVALSLPALHLAVTVKQLLMAGYAVTLILSAYAAAKHHARRDPRFLVAAVLPWITFFALLTQMHERYLIWGACLSAVWVASGTSLSLLHLLISAVAFLIMANSMAKFRPAGWPAMERVLQTSSPMLAWLVLAIAAVGILAAFTRSQGRGEGVR